MKLMKELCTDILLLIGAVFAAIAWIAFNVVRKGRVMAYHKKTGSYYELLGVACDATNGSEKAEPMAVYCREGRLFVRRLKEFLEKFTLSPLELDEVKTAMAAEGGE